MNFLHAIFKERKVPPLLAQDAKYPAGKRMKSTYIIRYKRAHTGNGAEMSYVKRVSGIIGKPLVELTDDPKQAATYKKRKNATAIIEILPASEAASFIIEKVKE